MKIPDPGQKCAIGRSPQLVLRDRAAVSMVREERARANFLSRSPKNFPAARSDRGKIESVLQTPAPLALRVETRPKPGPRERSGVRAFQHYRYVTRMAKLAGDSRPGRAIERPGALYFPWQESRI
jgi:hypothetical protein